MPRGHQIEARSSSKESEGLCHWLVFSIINSSPTSTTFGHPQFPSLHALFLHSLSSVPIHFTIALPPPTFMQAQGSLADVFKPSLLAQTFSNFILYPSLIVETYQEKPLTEIIQDIFISPVKVGANTTRFFI